MLTALKELSLALSVNIADDSNIILVVGLGRRRLWVSFYLLRNAFRVFHNIFGLHYSKG
jgi:hypothetical protein